MKRRICVARVSLLCGLILWGAVAAQDVRALTQGSPLGLESFTISAEGATAELSVRLSNAGDERVVAVAVGVVMVDAFNDAIAVHYVRWTDDLGTLRQGESVTLTSSVVEPRADELFLSIPYVYAVRYEDGEVWKENLGDVATELLSRFEVAASPSALQP